MNFKPGDVIVEKDTKEVFLVLVADSKTKKYEVSDINFYEGNLPGRVSYLYFRSTVYFSRLQDMDLNEK